MGGCRCSYRTCKSATKTTENLHFFHYPVKHRERCATWIQNAERPDFANLPDYQLRNKVVCGLHFEDRYFANMEKRRLVHNAIPTLNAGCESSEEEVTAYSKDMDIFPTSTDGSTFSMRFAPTKHSNTSSERIIFQQGGSMIVEPVGITDEPDVYTIDPSYFDQSFHSINKLKDVIINSTSVKKEEPDAYLTEDDNSRQQDEHCMLMFDGDARKHSSQETNGASLNFFFEDDGELDEESAIDARRTTNIEEELNENTNTSSGSHSSLDIRRNTPVMKKRIERNVMRRINNHALEIANIKRTLAAPGRITNKHLLRLLRGRLPDSLLGAVSIHLNKRSTVVTREEVQYERVVRTISPAARLVLKNNGWRVPGFNDLV